jgi:nucleoside-diphosphate-sugar epimerase
MSGPTCHRTPSNPVVGGMRIFIAGASGAIGRSLIAALTRRGHDVTGTTRTPTKTDQLAALGARPVVVDALDRDQLVKAVIDARPDVLIHQMTAIGAINFRDVDSSFALTNRLRTRATDYLLEAADAAGVRRFVAQSYTGWPNQRTGGPVKTEQDPLDPNPLPRTERTLAAIRHVESTVDKAGGVVLRYGSFYGPGNALGRGGDMLELVRKRRLPLVGGGTGIWSFIHIDDAAGATAVAAEDGPTGIFNIVDDEPAAVREWLPYLASVVGAKPPMRVPAWLVRPILGGTGMAAMTSVRGASNAKARRELGWVPRFGSWREGFRSGLG